MTERSQPDRRAIWSWACYDFANSPFTTLVVTFIYATYFTETIAPDSVTGTALWSRGVTVAAIAVALLSPFLGALADRGGYRKLFLLISTTICIVATVGLFGVHPGQTTRALLWFCVANIAFEMGMVFYNAFLPDIAPKEMVGRISGYGWGLGYAGGLIVLVIALVGFVMAEPPWFGLTVEDGENIRATNLMVAVWFAVFSLPIFLWVKEDKSAVTREGGILGASFRQFGSTLREIREHKQIFRFLIARLIYNDALVTIFAFGGIYAAGTFGFTMKEILIFGIVLNVAAGVGAFAMGAMDDKLGGKRTIAISLWGLMIATALAILAPTQWVFWVAGVLVGIFAGPNQSASRSIMARFVPPEKENEFFGFFAFSGKATAFLGPMLLGLLTSAFGSQRAGISVVLVLFALGQVLLTGVDEQEGIRAAGRGS